MAGEYEQAVWRMLIANRGGIPEKCDYCQQPYTETRRPMPEEGRSWSCTDCEKQGQEP